MRMEEMAPHHQQRRRRRSTASKEMAQTNRRIYDPRRWHKRSTSSMHMSGQPPAGWVLVWAGRFKRWRRRWFVAHPPGLLLHYKNSDQIGRPGCISLLGASVVPAAGKERQFKIMKGSMVYYLRTISRDYRQPWLDAIHESIRVYNTSVQKAAGGADYGTALIPQQSVPSHEREDWEAQERELNRRVAERLRDLEPSRQGMVSDPSLSNDEGCGDCMLLSLVEAFLQQLQSLQQSLSTISGVLGFAEHPEGPKKPATIVLPSLPRLPETSWRSNGLFIAENETFELDVSQQQNQLQQQNLPQQQNPTSLTNDDKLSSPEMGLVDPSQSHSGALSPPMLGGQENGSHGRNGSRSLFKWKSDAEARLANKELVGIRPQKSAPVSNLSGEQKFRRDRHRRSLSLSLDENVEDDPDSFPPDMSCIGAECFPGRKRNVHGNGNASDTELGSKKQTYKFSSPLPQWKRNGSDPSFMATPTSSQELEPSILRKLEKDLALHYKETEGSSHGSGSRSNGGSSHGNKEFRFGPGYVKTTDTHALPGQLPARNGFLGQGPLHAAWNTMQDTYTEALKEEIYRVLELEAENAVLQESLRSLPQLHQDRAALLSMRDRKNEKHCVCGRKNTSEEDDGDDTEEEVAIVHADVGNEEYFEALEVLNQYDYMARATSPEEQENLAERADGTQEPPEEAETGDTDVLSEAEGEETDQPRTRLPAPRPLSRGFSIWTVLKNAVGRDLNHITMPATINEPLSVLQKCAEELQYRDLLEQAVQKNDSLERLLLATAFTCASYYGSIHRDAKPFNPMLGETYEYQDNNNWFLAEQVSHHPPILAFQSESTAGSYQIYGEIEIKNKFWGRSIEVLCNGAVHFKIPKFGDHFTWNRATLCIHNVVVGKVWIDNYGEVTVRNHNTGEVGRVRFHKASSREQCRITGKVFDADGVPRYTIFGNYMEKIYSCPESCTNFDVDGPDVRLLWKAPEQIEDYRQQYCFTCYTLALNEMTPKLAEALPPTDSRFRPDQRALEDGDLEKATPEKLRLEDKQRIARRVRKEQGVEWQNMWFGQREAGVTEVKTIEDGCVEPSWVYKGTYWDARDKQSWENCPDIM